MARAAQSQATNLQNTDSSNAATLGGEAQGTYGALNPFLNRELNGPQGYSQADLTSQLSAAEAGAGGATSGLYGSAALQAARTRNASGFGSALDAAARSRQQAVAGQSEGIAANNADLKQKQQQSAASGLSSLYGANTDAMMKALGLQDQAIGTEAQAGTTGWLQNATGVLNAISGAGKSAAGLGLKF